MLERYGGQAEVKFVTGLQFSLNQDQIVATLSVK